MNVPYEVTGYLGHGTMGSVFSAQYDGQEVALKAHYRVGSDPKDVGRSVCISEFNTLSRLQGGGGIPQPILLLDKLIGSYEQLQLDRCGLPLDQVALESAEFSGVFISELIRGTEEMKHIWLSDRGEVHPEQIKPKSYFDRLEQIVKRVHKAGLIVPRDIEIITREAEPWLVDWWLAFPRENVGKKFFKESVKTNLQRIKLLRRKYQL